MNKEIRIKSTSVYDARSLAELVGIANEYDSQILFTMDDRCINAKSIMGMMGLGLDVEKELVIEAEGEDAAEAIAAMEAFLDR